MSPRSKITWLLAILALGLCAAATAQTGDIADMQLFAPEDVQSYSYGDGPQPHTGWYFNFDGLFWSIGRPYTSWLGLPPPNVRPTWYGDDSRLVLQQSEMSTDALQSNFVTGNRFQFGHMSEEHGIAAEVYVLQDQLQKFWGSNIPMVFDDPVVGPFDERRLQGLVTHISGVTPYPGQPNPPYIPPTLALRNLPITFRNVEAENIVDHWSAEISYVRRFQPGPHGGQFELLMGARYLEFNEQFNVNCPSNQIYDTTTQTYVVQIPNGMGTLADSYWNTNVTNHIIGPQVGGRYSIQMGRWVASTEGRYMAGFNQQNVQQAGAFGTRLTQPTTSLTPLNVPYAFGPTNFANAAFYSEFSSVVELRGELSFQVTKAILARAGWTGVWMNGIGRPSGMINYAVPAMGILNNNQDVLIQGFNIGVVINR